jgi:GTPase
VPGLIEGAHAGTGLGDRFLRHLERTRVLVHLLEVSPDPDRTPLTDYRALRKEVELYDPGLAARPEIVVLNKIDLPETRKELARLREAFARRNLPFLAVSAVTGEGIQDLLEAMWKRIRSPVEVPPSEKNADNSRRAPGRRSSARSAKSPPKAPAKAPRKTPRKSPRKLPRKIARKIPGRPAE